MISAVKVFDKKSQQVGRLLLLLDLLLTSFVFLVSYDIRAILLPDNQIDFQPHLALLPILLAALGVQMWAAGAYRGLRVESLVHYCWIVLRAVSLSLVALFTVLFLLKATYASRGLLLVFGATLGIVLISTRAALMWWYFFMVGQKANDLKILIVGTGERARRLVEKMREKAEWGIDIIGHLNCGPASPLCVDAPVLGHVSEIHDVLRRHVVDEVVVAVPRAMLKDVQQIADACEEEGVTLRLRADVFDLRIARMGLVDLDGVPLLTFDPVAHDEVQLIAKRIIDLAITLLAMPVVLPIMAIVAIAIKLDSPGPVLFFQERVGFHKRKFRMYKFRSMQRDAESRMKEVEHLNEARGPIFKIAKDPRITRIGGFLRRTSLDELPQLFNVLYGDMSLVGPRPMSLRDVSLFDEAVQRKRFSVRPGLTGLWQVSGRSNLAFSKWIELDLKYIDGWSLGLDFKILLRTVPAVFRGAGAV